MSGNIRFTWLRPGGWTRLGVVVAVAIMFSTPMLWSLGAFGDGDEALRRALIFLFSGLWFGIGIGYAASWALRGFVLRAKDHDDDDDEPAHARPAVRPPAPAHPPARPGH
ncbi:conserved exported protein of unknown function [Magnetospirillum gryphiswaldense MSR-1 v2]|uniref:Uncharacterized protein n=1 Tax=Magnetospirillum gryphiswaldense (strain DSM 6361 / JCM 21280 / NBRC 15271 / MSR-1) TaxID=431944 RepID=V6F6Y0_MAGGM|nr:hypothetical protein [Magnetospirillum gryphiswaldense]CDL01260.1 conserved exported protein of unknown function [Magnetospirillum gryphiswaldense MSR-1 v2]